MSDKPVRPLQIGARPRRLSDASLQALTENPSPWTLREKPERFYYAPPPGNDVFDAMKDAHHGLLAPEELAPVSIDALKIRIKQCLDSMLPVVQKAEKTGKVSQQLLARVRSTGKALNQECEGLTNATPDKVLQIRDRLVRFFNEEFAQLVKTAAKTSVQRQLGADVSQVEGYHLPDFLIRAAGDILASYRYSHFTIEAAKEMIGKSESHHSTVSQQPQLTDPETIDKKTAALLKGMSRFLISYSVQRTKIRDYSFTTSPATSLFWVRLQYDEEDGANTRKGHETVVISTSGGILGQQNLRETLSNVIKDNPHLEFREAPLLAPSAELKFTHFFDKDLVLSGVSPVRSADAEFKALHCISEKLEELQKEGKQVHGVILLITSSRPCATCCTAISEFEHRYPNIKVIEVPHLIVMTTAELASWDQETERQYKGKSSVLPCFLQHDETTDDQTRQVSTVDFIRVRQERRKAAIELSASLEELTGEKILVDNIEFLPWPHNEDLTGRPIFRLQYKHPFVYVQTSTPGHFVRVRPRTLKIKPNDTVVTFGRQSFETEEGRGESSSDKIDSTSSSDAEVLIPRDLETTGPNRDLFFESFLKVTEQSASINECLTMQFAKPMKEHDALAENLIQSDIWEALIAISAATDEEDFQKDSYLQSLTAKPTPFNPIKSNMFRREIKGFVESPARRAIEPLQSGLQTGTFDQKEIDLANDIKRFYFENPDAQLPGDSEMTGVEFVKYVINEQLQRFRKNAALKMLRHADAETMEKITTKMSGARELFSGGLSFLSQPNDVAGEVFEALKMLTTQMGSFREKGRDENWIKTTVLFGFQQKLRKFNIPEESHSFLQAAKDYYFQRPDPKPETMQKLVFDTLRRQYKEYKRLARSIRKIRKQLNAAQPDETHKEGERSYTVAREISLFLTAYEFANSIHAPYGKEISYNIKTANHIGETPITAQVKKIDEDETILRILGDGIQYLAISTPALKAAFPPHIQEEESIGKEFTFQKNADGELTIEFAAPHRELHERCQLAVDSVSRSMRTLDTFLASETSTQARERAMRPMQQLRRELSELSQRLSSNLTELQSPQISPERIGIIARDLYTIEHRDLPEEVADKIQQFKNEQKHALAKRLQLAHDATHDALAKLNAPALPAERQTHSSLQGDLQEHLTVLNQLWDRFQQSGISEFDLVAIEQDCVAAERSQEELLTQVANFRKSKIHGDLQAAQSLAQTRLTELNQLMTRLSLTGNNEPADVGQLRNDLGTYIRISGTHLWAMRTPQAMRTPDAIDEHLANGTQLLNTAGEQIQQYRQQLLQQIRQRIARELPATIALLEQLRSPFDDGRAPSEAIRGQEESLSPLRRTLAERRERLEGTPLQEQESAASEESLMAIDRYLDESPTRNLASQVNQAIRSRKGSREQEIRRTSQREHDLTTSLLEKLQSSISPNAPALRTELRAHLNRVATIREQARRPINEGDLVGMERYFVQQRQTRLFERAAELWQEKLRDDLQAAQRSATEALSEVQRLSERRGTVVADGDAELRRDLANYVRDTEAHLETVNVPQPINTLRVIDEHMATGTRLSDAARERILQYKQQWQNELQQNIERERDLVQGFIGELNLPLTARLSSAALRTQGEQLIFPLRDTLTAHRDTLNGMLTQAQGPMMPEVDLQSMETYLADLQTNNFRAQVTQQVQLFRQARQIELRESLPPLLDSANQLLESLALPFPRYRSGPRWQTHGEVITGPLRVALETHMDRLRQIAAQVQRPVIPEQDLRRMEESLVQQQHDQQQLTQRLVRLREREMNTDLRDEQTWAIQAQTELGRLLLRLGNNIPLEGVLLGQQLARYLYDTQAHLATMGDAHSMQTLDAIDAHLMQRRANRYLIRLQTLHQALPPPQPPQVQDVQPPQPPQAPPLAPPPAPVPNVPPPIQQNEAAPRPLDWLRRWRARARRHFPFIGRVEIPDQTAAHMSAIAAIESYGFPKGTGKMFYRGVFAIGKNGVVIDSPFSSAVTRSATSSSSQASMTETALPSTVSNREAGESLPPEVEEKAIKAFNTLVAGHAKDSSGGGIPQWVKGEREFVVEDPNRLNFEHCNAVRMGNNLSAETDYFLVTGIVRKQGGAGSLHTDAGILMKLSGEQLAKLNRQKVGEGQKVSFRVDTERGILELGPTLAHKRPQSSSSREKAGKRR